MAFNLSHFFASFQKYGTIAAQAVQQVQTEVGASNGDTTVQQSKKMQAVGYVLAAAHAGEQVPIPVVQEISGVVDFIAGLAKALGLFGKTPAIGSTVVAVPSPATP